MTTANMNRVKLNNAELEMVNGGTFTADTLEDSRYTEVGITAKRHFFEKNEYWLPDGTKTDMDGADAYVMSVVGEETFSKWVLEALDDGCDDPYGTAGF